MKRLMIFLVLSMQMYAQSALAADYVREKKWADEIVPGVVVGDAMYLKQANGHKFLALYTPAEDKKTTGAKTAIILAHGIGVHPDWGLISVLRSALVDEGFGTLSIQMPVLANEAKSRDYAPELPEAHERLALATAFLKTKGYSSVAIVSHSLGSAMAYGYLAATPDPVVKTWVSLGLSPNHKLGVLKLNVLDMFGEKDLPEVLANAVKRKKSLNKNMAGKAGSRQLRVPGADHFFTGMDNEMVNAVSGFIRETAGK